MSLRKLEVQEAEALQRLKMDPAFGVLLALIGQEAAILNEQLIKSDLTNDEKNVLIGQLRFAAGLTDAVQQSEHTLQQHSKPPS